MGKHQFDIYISKPELGNVLTLKKHEWVINNAKFDWVFQILIGKIKSSNFQKFPSFPILQFLPLQHVLQKHPRDHWKHSDGSA
jgi:hypothetical protein